MISKNKKSPLRKKNLHWDHFFFKDDPNKVFFCNKQGFLANDDKSKPNNRLPQVLPILNASPPSSSPLYSPTSSPAPLTLTNSNDENSQDQNQTLFEAPMPNEKSLFFNFQSDSLGSSDLSDEFSSFEAF